MSKGSRIRRTRNKDEHEKATRKAKLAYYPTSRGGPWSMLRKGLTSRSKYNPGEEQKKRLEEAA